MADKGVHLTSQAAIGGARLIAMVCLVCVLVMTAQASAAKRKRGPVTPPELKIMSVALAPQAYVAGDGTLDFTIDLELPKDIGRHLLLEVSTLISSPSMRSMRFLSNRQSIENQEQTVAATQSSGGKPRIEVRLSWDGLDQSKERATTGIYDYEIRAKLLAVGDNGVRTHMNAWPKRGTLIVK